MDKEIKTLNGKAKTERISRIKDYFVLFQWIDKTFNPQFESQDVSTIDFSKIEVSLEKEQEGENK